ncbi:SMI1/KNR4 family protein [Paenibacillus sedimenti]|uniref:SMI1/KNR4 family protein n=1 Tax=Paenibacillus sedimenti TaxID=2770274 RepID=A0A926KZ78_9BACL|nr:SMI1/KNR4 family protein [Paenibacillus sedimenti]MBD0384824.1 SMI1/KNR4 family protein [Paenibacillus sedimenti]
MNFNEFMFNVDDIKSKNPIWFMLDSDPVGTDNQIKVTQLHLSLSLPEEYKVFIKTFGGGFFAFVNIFSVNKESNWNIVEQNNRLGLKNSHNFLAISDSGTGDFYGFEIVNGVCSPAIKVYDHEKNQVESTVYENLYDYLVAVGLKVKK